MRAPMPSPTSRTTLPGPDGPGTISVIVVALLAFLLAETSRRSGRRRAEAAVCRAEVGEPVEVAGRNAGGGKPVGDLAGRRVRGERLVHQRDRYPGDRAQLDGDHVVEHPAAVGEPGQVTADDAELARAGARRDRGVEPDHVREDRAGVVLEPGDDAWRD